MYRRPAIFLLIWLITLGLSGVEGYGQGVGHLVLNQNISSDPDSSSALIVADNCEGLPSQDSRIFLSPRLADYFWKHPVEYENRWIKSIDYESHTKIRYDRSGYVSEVDSLIQRDGKVEHIRTIYRVGRHRASISGKILYYSHNHAVVKFWMDFDASGDVAEWSQANWKKTFAYDTRGNCVSYTIFHAGDTVRQLFEYIYDIHGSLIEERQIGGGERFRTVDEAGRLIEERIGESRIAYHYNLKGEVEEEVEISLTGEPLPIYNSAVSKKVYHRNEGGGLFLIEYYAGDGVGNQIIYRLVGKDEFEVSTVDGVLVERNRYGLRDVNSVTAYSSKPLQNVESFLYQTH